MYQRSLWPSLKGKAGESKAIYRDAAAKNRRQRDLATLDLQGNDTYAKGMIEHDLQKTMASVKTDRESLYFLRNEQQLTAGLQSTLVQEDL